MPKKAKKRKAFRMRKPPEPPVRMKNVRRARPLQEGDSLQDCIDWADKASSYRHVYVEWDYPYYDGENQAWLVYHRDETEKEFDKRQREYEEKLAVYKEWESQHSDEIAEYKERQREKNLEAAEKKRKRLEKELAQHEKKAAKLRKQLGAE